MKIIISPAKRFKHFENEKTEVKHTAVKKQGKICPLLKKECIKRSCEWYCGSEECCRICNIMTRW